MGSNNRELEHPNGKRPKCICDAEVFVDATDDTKLYCKVCGQTYDRVCWLEELVEAWREQCERQREGAAKNVSGWMEAAEIEHGTALELKAEVERLRTENTSLRSLLPDPREMAGWDDEDVPPDMAKRLAALAKFQGIQAPRFVLEAAASP